MLRAMSMKRTKETTRKRADDAAGGFWEKKETERTYSWATDVASQPDDPFLRYQPTARFDAGMLVFHVKFGKGIVTGALEGKLEILFEAGPKTLAYDPAGHAPERATIPPG